MDPGCGDALGNGSAGVGGEGVGRPRKHCPASSARRRRPATRPRYHRSAFWRLPTACRATHTRARPPKPPAETSSRRNRFTANPPQVVEDYTKTTRKKTRRADQPWVSPSPASGSACSARRRCAYLWSIAVWKSKFCSAFVLNRRGRPRHRGESAPDTLVDSHRSVSMPPARRPSSTSSS